MKKKNLFLIPILALGCHNSAIAQNFHPSLQKTASKLNTAGDYISMTKLDGDMGAITQYLEIILQTARKNGEPIPENFTAKELFRILGVNTLKAAGSSAKELDNAWINHSYLENGGNNTGIFSLLGEADQAPVVPNICPAGTDLALQLQLDLRQLAPMLIEIAKLSGEDKMVTNMEKNIPELNMTPTQLLAKLNATISIALDVNTDEAAQTNPIAIATGANAVIRIDGLNWIWDKLGDQIIAQSGAPMEKAEADGIITYTIPAEMRGQLMGYSPQLVIDNKAGHIWISSSPEFLTKCKSGQNTLADSAEFKAAMEHLPSNANSMMYLSKDFLKTAKSQYDNAAKTNMFGKDFAKGKEIADRLMEDITESDKGWAMALTKDADGILIASRGPVGLQHLNYLTSATPLMTFLGSYRMMEQKQEAQFMEKEAQELRREMK